MKTLADILYRAGIVEVMGSTAIYISNICFDSRRSTKDSLFVAVRGEQSDGHNFIDTSIALGAKAIICEELPQKVQEDITYVKVRNSRIALAFSAANYYGNPSEKLKLIGVTGTNGKTTIASLLFKLFRSHGYNAGLISTIKNQINDQVIPTTHTTPDALQLNALLSAMTDEGCTHCFMEVSSHAIAQQRIAASNYSVGIFTNITHDHLDYHKSFEEYLKAKKQFFDSLNEEAFALTNIDDKNGLVVIQNTKAKKKTYSLRSMSDFKCKIIENNFSGLQLNIDGHDVFCKLIGSFNAYNLLAIYATAILLGEEKLKVLTTLSNLDSVEGRFEYVTSTNNITGIIDYAHTPDALQNVLSTIKDIKTANEKVITVVGCGGNRDVLKRPVMASIACELSDRVVLTSDNPRSEDPDMIIREMQKGVTPIHYKKVLSIVDRKEAIKTAGSLAQPGDVILIAGKGHEKYQEIKGVKYPFDDKQVLLETFKMLN